MVFADYDVDGATSAALLVRWFRAMGKTLPVYVPDRLTEGYGPSPAAFPSDARRGRRTRRHRGLRRRRVTTPLSAAAEIGLDVVVVDHHLMRATSPAAAALVNPNRADCRSGQGMLAAAGVTFVLLAALNREARRRDLFDDGREPDPRQWLDLAALGAICDVTQLTGFNRALTAHGLRAMSSWGNPGLAALDAGRRAPGWGPAGVFEAGFMLGPQDQRRGTHRPSRPRRPPARHRRLRAKPRIWRCSSICSTPSARRWKRRSPTRPERRDRERQQFRPGRARSGRRQRGLASGRHRHRRQPIARDLPQAGGGHRHRSRGGTSARGRDRSQPGVNLGRVRSQAAFDEGLRSGGWRSRHGGRAPPEACGPGGYPASSAPFYASVSRPRWPTRARGRRDRHRCAGRPGVGAATFSAAVRRGLAPFGPGNPEPVYAVRRRALRERLRW